MIKISAPLINKYILKDLRDKDNIIHEVIACQ